MEQVGSCPLRGQEPACYALLSLRRSLGGWALQIRNGVRVFARRRRLGKPRPFGALVLVPLCWRQDFLAQ